METTRTMRLLGVSVLVASCAGATPTLAKGKKDVVSPDDPTYQLFRLLDNSYGGKLTNFCLVADTFADPSNAGVMLQHVLRLEYDKNLFFGRLRIYMRGVSQLTLAQLKEYTPAQIYGFGSDFAKFEKINPGPFGEEGDVYFRASAIRPLTPVPITDEVRKEYEFLLTRFVQPALEKNKPQAGLPMDSLIGLNPGLRNRLFSTELSVDFSAGIGS